jgi:pimeloyl-ACP methyl ester carboxylesterase
VREAQRRKHEMNRGKEFTIERMVEDLRRLISSSSQQERPIMFIGSEFGSMIIRFYAQLYQDDISHLVLVNPLAENLFTIDDSIWRDHWYEHIIPSWYGYALGSVLGINRLLMTTGLLKPQLNSIQLDNDITNRQKHLMSSPKHLFSVIDELSGLNDTLKQMKLIWTIKPFPDNIPVTIINSKQDSIFSRPSLFGDDERTSLNDDLIKAWQSSTQFLVKKVHKNAQVINIDDDSLFNRLYNKNSNESDDFFIEKMKQLILKWRDSKQNADNIKTI